MRLLCLFLFALLVVPGRFSAPSRQAGRQGDRCPRRPVTGVRRSNRRPHERDPRPALRPFHGEFAALTAEADWTAEGVERSSTPPIPIAKISVVFGFGILTVRAVAEAQGPPKADHSPVRDRGAAAGSATAWRRQRQNETSATSPRSSTSATRLTALRRSQGASTSCCSPKRRRAVLRVVNQTSTSRSFRGTDGRSPACSHSEHGRRPRHFGDAPAQPRGSRALLMAITRPPASEHRHRPTLARPGRDDVDPLAEQLGTPGTACGAQPRPHPRGPAGSPRSTSTSRSG